MTILRSSEFWIAVAAAAGTILAKYHVIPQAEWDQYLAPALVYIVGRLTSKTVKAVIK